MAYHELEGWGYVDSFYFTGITLSTIGYGDLYPTTDISKIFTVFFAFAGIGILAAALSIIAGAYFEKRERLLGESLHKRLLNGIKGNEQKRKEIVDGANESL